MKSQMKRAFELKLSVAAAVFSLILTGCSGGNPSAEAVNDLKSLTVSKTGTLNYLDSINGVTDLTHGMATVPKKDKLTVVGWAVDLPTKSLAKAVYIVLDGKTYASKYGMPRSDVATVFKEQAFTNSGFSADLPVPSGDGEHKLILNIASSDGKTYYVGSGATFVVR